MKFTFLLWQNLQYTVISQIKFLQSIPQSLAKITLLGLILHTLHAFIQSKGQVHVYAILLCTNCCNVLGSFNLTFNLPMQSKATGSLQGPSSAYLSLTPMQLYSKKDHPVYVTAVAVGKCDSAERIPKHLPYLSIYLEVLFVSLAPNR